MARILGGTNNHLKQKTIGLGMSPAGMANASVAALFKEAGSCPIYAMPTVGSVRWGFRGPVTQAFASANLGANITVLSGPTVPVIGGPVSIDATAGLINGEFQTHIFACAVGVKAIPDPYQFTAQGNSITSPALAAAKPASPNVFTVRDVGLNAGVGAGGSGLPASMVPATYEHGWWANYALWNMIHSYNLRWTYGSLINILDEELRQTAYMPPGAQSSTAGVMDLDLTHFINEMNGYYASNLGSLKEFLSIDSQRLGSVGAGATSTTGVNVSSFRPSRDFQLVSPMVGGADFHSALGCNSEFRTLTNSYILDPGVPPGLIFEENDTTFGNVFRSYMRADYGSAANGVPAAQTDGALVAAGAGTFFNEQTLDSPPVTAQQATLAQTETYKFGSAFLAIEVKGYEITKQLALKIQADPTLQDALQSTCGACCGMQ